MERENVQKAIQELKQYKRKFSQSFDLIINLKGINLKTTPVDFFVTLPHSQGKKVKVACFADQQMAEPAQKYCDILIKDTQFPEYADKKKAKRLAQDYDFFISQANLMPKVAQVFGKALGIRGKMPNPKLGCVVPPNANLEVLTKRLYGTLRLQAKKGLNLQCLVGKEDQAEEEVIKNIIAIYEATIKHLPNERHDVKNVLLKLTMSKAVKIYG